jgi:hypothetical protein
VGVDTNSVAKLRVIVCASRVTPARKVACCPETYLLSRKRASGSRKDDLLEFFGGHLQENETPWEGLMRELHEEDTSGTLAALTRKAAPAPIARNIGTAPHYLFTVTVAADDVQSVTPATDESYGVEFRDVAAVHRGALDDQLTPRTRAILKTYGAPSAEAIRHAQ